MLGAVSAVQRVVDLLGLGRTGRRVRFVRFPTLVACGVAPLFVIGVSSASAEVWTTEGETHYLKTNYGELIKSWTAKEWQVWRKELQSLGECMGLEEHCAERESSGSTPVDNVPRTTAEAAQEGVRHAREEEGLLSAQNQNGLDLVGEDAGTLPFDLGVTGTIGGFELGATSTIVGVELGNGLDQLFELPAWHPVTEVQKTELAEKNLEIQVYTEPHTEREEVCNVEDICSPHEFSLPKGTYLQKIMVEGEDIWPGYGVIHTGIYCENAYTMKNCNPYEYYTGVPFSIEEEFFPPLTWERIEHSVWEYSYYPGGYIESLDTGVYFHGKIGQCIFNIPGEEGSTRTKPEPLEVNPADECKPIGVPGPGKITPEIEAHNVSRGLPARPKDSSPISLPKNPPSSLSEGDIKEISEQAPVRERIEEMFPGKKHEETEVEEKEGELLGPDSPGEPGRKDCLAGKPVNCATGNEVQTETDLSVGGRGPGLQQALTYNSLLAVKQATAGPFGFGWTDSYSAYLELKEEGKEATIHQGNGSTVTFTHSGEAWSAPTSLTQATLADEGTGYVYTLPNQTKLAFSSAGRLTKETDRNGNAITLAYNAEKQLETATDGAGRKLTFKYNGSGEVESVKDPMGHTVKYTYESGNLATVTRPGEEKAHWKYKYNSEHELTSATDGREHATTIEYNEAHQVSSQTDAMSRKRAWKYAPTETGTETAITEPNGAATVEQFNEYGSPTSVTRASGKSYAATTAYEYNGADELVAVVDPNKHKTEYVYDSAGNKICEKDADGDEARWTYNSKHEVETETTPGGETTTIKRNSAGDPEVIERPAPGSVTQKTTYKYDADGDVESMTNPLERTWRYEYDSYGDRKAEADPEGDKRTWEYNEDSREIAEVSPRGNAAGAKASEFTTKTERDTQGRPLKVTDPLGHTTKYTYDGDGNVETVIDGNSHKTKYIYDADNELTKTEEPNKTITETEYDSMGRVKSRTDGNKHVTKYVRNALEEVEEEVNPLAKKTLKEYDEAGNLVKLTDPTGRTTTYTYDPADRLTEVSYSSGNPSTVKYEYNKNGDRTKITDGTGATTYTLDQLDRMTESENGHKEVVKYEYNLGNQQTKITYPSTKVVERAYDKDGRLEKVTDWNSKITKFSYNADSELEKTTFPSETKDEDTYAYNDADQMSEVKMKKSSETLGSLVYTRDSDGQVKKITSKDLPGAEVTENVYDENNRLTKYGSTEYKYDAANNPTKEGSSTNTFNEGDELEKGTGETYAYDELGERTKTTPEKGPATAYDYDQTGNLISAERPKEGETSEIKDTYVYNGEDLRTSQTISGTTSYLAWDMTEGLPLILNDTTNSYIYGPGDLPIEQINNTTGTVLYLHHDQAGSTRLLTGSTGKTEGSYSYSAYGTPEHTGTATTPLGYDAQYTSNDTGLIYMRARVYDPATAQFLSADPLAGITRSTYNYAGDNPLNYWDPTGLILGIPGTPSFSEVVKGVSHAAGAVATVTSVAAAGCAVVAAPTGVGEVACGAVGTVALATGAVATAGDAYLAAVGAQGPGPAIFDVLGLGAGVGGGAFGDDELGAYAKTYGSLLSAAAFGEPFAEDAAEARGEGIGCGL
jgi:RHS repeat-associated protein